MFARVLSAAFALSLFALSVEARTPLAKRAPGYTYFGSSLHARQITGQGVAFACIGGGGDCQCPTDNTGAAGVLTNVFPGYQCAYPSGACTWDDVTGVLQNPGQANCPTSDPCSTTAGCSCPLDNTGATGILINQFTGYQCAYPSGACTWDGNGDLQNTAQGNCPTPAKCQQSGVDS